MPEWSNGFPHFLQFKSEFGNKEFMIWATVSSQSCFCWLYRASPSLAAKDIINLILMLTIWWCPCVESSPVFLEESVCYDQWLLLAEPCYLSSVQFTKKINLSQIMLIDFSQCCHGQKIIIWLNSGGMDSQRNVS